MAQWVELPNKNFVNLDRISVLKPARNTHNDWSVFGYSDSGAVSLADSLKDEESAVTIIRELLKDQHPTTLSTHFPADT